MSCEPVGTVIAFNQVFAAAVNEKMKVVGCFLKYLKGSEFHNRMVPLFMPV
jgi:hypothetical protein